MLGLPTWLTMANLMWASLRVSITAPTQCWLASRLTRGRLPQLLTGMDRQSGSACVLLWEIATKRHFTMLTHRIFCCPCVTVDQRRLRSEIRVWNVLLA